MSRRSQQSRGSPRFSLCRKHRRRLQQLRRRRS